MKPSASNQAVPVMSEQSSPDTISSPAQQPAAQAAEATTPPAVPSSQAKVANNASQLGNESKPVVSSSATAKQQPAAPVKRQAPTPATKARPSAKSADQAKITPSPANQPNPNPQKTVQEEAVILSVPATSATDLLPLLPQSAREKLGQLSPWVERGSQMVRQFFRPQGLPLRLLWGCVLLPTLIVFLYLALFASDIYLSEAKFAIRSQDQQQSLDMLSSFFRSSSSTSSDSYIVQNYIQSMDMIDKVDAKLHIREHYADRSQDIWFRLTRNASQDELLRYWNWVVVATFDPDTSIMTIQVKAFSPQMAQAVCQAILDASESLVNAMNERARSDAISLAQAEVVRAENRIRNAQEAMRQYRERTVILDPQAVATGLYGLVNQLEGEITRTTADLAEASTYMQADSPRVVMLQNRLEVLQKQLQAEKARLASQMQGDKPLSAMVSEFQSLTLEEEFAQKQLTSAMTSLETARIQAESKSLYVESFQKPMVPDESLYPRPIVFSLVFMLAAAVLLGLVSLIIAAIREHAGF